MKNPMKIQANILVEQALLAGVLIDNKNMQQANILSADDFYDSRNRAIYARIKELYASGKVIDLTTFFGTEYENYILELMELQDGLINTEKYIAEIKENSYKRKLLFRLDEIKIKGQENDFNDIKMSIMELSRELEKNVISNFNFINPYEIVAKKPSFLLKEFIPLPVGAVSMISSKGGSGKSMLALQIALRASSQELKTLAWLSEDPVGLTKHRLGNISHFTGIIPKKEYLNFIDQIPFQILQKEFKTVKVNPLFYELKAACKGFQIVIIDPLIAFFGADENDNSTVRLFMDLLTEWAKQDGKAIILLHHQTKYKDVSIARGAGAFTDAVRVHYSVAKDEDDDKNVIVKIEKDNWGIKTFFTKKSIQIFKENYAKQY